MDESRYDFYIDGDCVAENMSLEAVTMLLQAVFTTYHAMPKLEVTVKRRCNDAGND